MATNSMAGDVELVLDPFDLRKHFEVGGDARRLQQDASRHPDAFLVAAERLGLELDAVRCVVIEDATKGVVAAETPQGVPVSRYRTTSPGRTTLAGATVVLDSMDDVTVRPGEATWSKRTDWKGDKLVSYSAELVLRFLVTAFFAVVFLAVGGRQDSSIARAISRTSPTTSKTVRFPPETDAPAC